MSLQSRLQAAHAAIWIPPPIWNAYLQEEATQNPQLVRENPPLYGQIIILLNLSGKRRFSRTVIFFYANTRR